MNEASKPNTVQGLLQPAIDAALAALENIFPWEIYAKIAIVRRDGAVLATNAADHAASAGMLTAAFQKAFGNSWAEGDAAITNDVDAGCGHVCELAALAPLWPAAAKGRPEAFALVRAQAPDLGGWELGGYSPQAIDRWAEAARFEPSRFTRNGRPRREVREMLTLNSRTPKATSKLIDALQNSLDAAQERAGGVFTDDAALVDGDSATLFAAELQALEAGLTTLPQGTITGTAQLQSPFPDIGGSIIASISNGDAHTEVSVEAPPVHQLPVNLTEGQSMDIVLAALAAGLGGQTLSSGAALERIVVRINKPGMAAATLPSPTGLGRQSTGQSVFKAVVAALGNAGCKADPDKLWNAYSARWIGATLDWDKRVLDGALNTKIRKFEAEEPEHGAFQV